MQAFEDPFAGKKGIYQFTMSHLPHGRLFQDEEDYTYGVNSLAVATRKVPVDLLGYTLMSNHVHLLLAGKYSDCYQYYQTVIRRLGRMISRKYRKGGLLKADAFNVTAVMDRQMFVSELAYILRNAYRGRIASPFSYLWSSADVYFNPLLDSVRGVPFSQLTQEQKRAVLKSHEKVPDEWEHIDGRILNRCFLAYRKAEYLLEDSLRLFDRLRLYDLESSVRMSHGLSENIRFSDAQLQEKISMICQKEYHVDSLHQLDRKSLLLLARSLSRRFAATKSQLRRLLSLTDEVLDQLL